MLSRTYGAVIEQRSVIRQKYLTLLGHAALTNLHIHHKVGHSGTLPCAIAGATLAICPASVDSAC